MDDDIRAELSEIFHNASLMRLDTLALHMGIKPLVDRYIEENFGRRTMQELEPGELKALLDMVFVFTKMVRRDAVPKNPRTGAKQLSPRSIDSVSQRDLRADPIMAQSIEWHRRTKGTVRSHDETFDALSPYFQTHDISAGKYHYLHCGTKSSTAQLYGADFAAGAKGKPGIPDREFDEALREDYYRVAQCGVPMAQIVRSKIDVWGTPYYVAYCRYIFMTTLQDGQPAATVCSRFIEPPQRMDQAPSWAV